MKSGDEEYIKIYFDWNIVNWCDYRCSYCFVKNDLNDDFKSQWFSENYTTVINRLRTVQTSFQICITGGEPTLHPNFLEIISKISSIKTLDEIIIFTNLARPVNTYLNINTLKSNKIKLFASYHPEFSDNKFIEKCIEISNFEYIDFVVHLTLSDLSIYWEKTLNLIKMLKTNNIKFKPMLIVNTKNYNVNYNEDFYNTFSSILEESEFYEETNYNGKQVKNYDIILQNKNNFKDYSCRTTSFRITMDGNIENTCTNRKIPFILNNKNLIVNEICPHDKCISDRMIEFFKEKNG